MHARDWSIGVYISPRGCSAADISAATSRSMLACSSATSASGSANGDGGTSASVRVKSRYCKQRSNNARIMAGVGSSIAIFSILSIMSRTSADSRQAWEMSCFGGIRGANQQLFATRNKPTFTNHLAAHLLVSAQLPPQSCAQEPTQTRRRFRAHWYAVFLARKRVVLAAFAKGNSTTINQQTQAPAFPSQPLSKMHCPTVVGWP